MRKLAAAVSRLRHAPACTLLVHVDDATGRLMQLQFMPTESTQAYFAATRDYLERHGNSARLTQAQLHPANVHTTTDATRQ